MLEIQMSGIKKIEEIVKAGKPGEYVSLSQGSVKIGGIPESIKNHLAELLKTDVTDYYESCWGLKVLREKIASVLSARYNTKISVAQTLPTHGAIGGLTLLYLTLLKEGDEVIIPEPAYPAYGILAKASRSTPVFVSCSKEEGGPFETLRSSGRAPNKTDFELNVERIKAATTDKTKMIVFSNPWNPLGIIVPPAVMNELVAWCELKKIYLIIDEAYRDYAFDNTYETVIPLINKSEWIVCVNTFSKNMAMSGWRVGYLLVPEKLAPILVGMQDALLNCLNNTAQYAATFALDHPELTEVFYKQLLYNRDMTINMLEPLVNRGIISFNKPDGGIFLFMKTDQKDAMELCMSLLNTAKVGLIPGSSFGPSGAPFLRLCYARETEVLEEGLRRIVNYFV